MDLTNPNTSIVKTEEFDVNMAKYIASRDIDFEDKKKIKMMLKNKSKGNQLEINYVLGKVIRRCNYVKGYMGRLFANGNYGLQTLHSDIRKALAKDYYWDLDMVNAQGELLNQLAMKNGWTNNLLNQFCINRELIFEQLIKDSHNHITRDDCKRMFISLFFGGKPVSISDDWVRDEFYPEINTIMKNLCNLYPDLLADCKKRREENPLGSCCAYILQSEENKCLMALDTYLTQNKRSLDTFIFDGGLIRKLEGESVFPMTLIDGACEYIEKMTGYKLKMSIKKMETSWKMPNQADIDEDNTYQGMKLNFEKTKFG